MSQAGRYISGSGGSPVETLTGNSGGAVPPTGGNINVVGTGGVTVTGNPGTSTLTISISGGGFTWSEESGAFDAEASNGYFITATSTATLPSTPSMGDSISFSVATADILTIQAVAGQFISFSNLTSISGGNITNNDQGDCASLVYNSNTSTWHVVSAVGITWNVETT